VNLGQLRQATLDLVGVPASDSFFSTSQLNTFVNEAVQAWQHEEAWPWHQGTETLTTVAGTASYSPIDPMWTMTKNLYIAGFEPMVLSNQPDVDYVTVQGQPVAYYVFQEKIVLSPTPDGVYSVTHQYYKGEPFLVNDTDTPLTPAEFHYAIVAYAAHLALLRAGEVSYYRGNITGRSAALMQEYTQWLERARSNRRRSARMITPRVRPGSWL